MLMPPGPPQVSAALPVHGMLQVLSLIGAPGDSITLSQSTGKGSVDKFDQHMPIGRTHSTPGE